MKSKFFLFSAIIFTATIFGNESSFQEVVDKNPLKVLTPSLQNQVTKKLILSNGLQVLLISDPEAIQSSAALSVGVGSWNDIEEYPGVAHFCEHMLFMGSKNYPEENGFFQHVSTWDGMVNAYTKPDRTVYMFSCNHGGLNEGLDRFSGFFTNPLFNEGSISRELNAVHQEFMKNVQNDGWIAWQIFKQEQNQSHPNSKFSTGTRDTLKIIPRNTLIDWYRSHYSSDKMYLVIYSNEDVDTLTQWSNKYFSLVPQNKELKDLPYGKMSSSEQEGHITFIDPVKDIKNLTISWEIPREFAVDLDSKAAQLIGYALSNKSDNSLIQYLRSEGLAEDIHTDVDVVGTQNHLLQFEFALTKKGVEHLDVVITRFYQALNQIKKRQLPTHLYHEYRRQTQLAYEWQSRVDAFTYAMEYADSLVDEPLETFPYKSTTFSTYNPKQTKELLLYLTPYNAMVAVQAPSSLTKQVPDRTEKWMKGQYCVIQVSEQQLSLWDQAEPHSKINLPFPNAFIANSLSLHSKEVTSDPTEPSLLADEAFGKCYVWEDTFYSVPETGVELSIKSPAMTEGNKSITMVQLYTSFLRHKMSPLTSLGSRGGIHTKFSRDDFSLNVHIHGFSEKFSPYVLSLLDKMKNTLPSKGEFELEKEQLLVQYENRTRSLPVMQGLYLMNSALSNTSPTGQDLHKNLQSISYEDFVSFVQNIYTENYVECLLGGNFDGSEAKALWKGIKGKLEANVYSDHKTLLKKTLVLPKQEKGPFTLSLDTELQGNSALLTLQIGDSSQENIATQQLLHKVLAQSFFDTLRTKQQTGYITKCINVEEKDVLMYVFLVHSTSHYPSELLARFDLFLEDFSRNIETEISEEYFGKLKETLVSTLSKNSENMSSHLNNTYSLAFEHEGNFSRKQDLIAAINAKQYADFIAQSKEMISRENTRRIGILVNGAKASPNAFQYVSTSIDQLYQLRN